MCCEISTHRPQENEGINAAQSKELHGRAKKVKPGSSTGMVEVERWNDVYKIIFPGESTIPTPYYDRFLNA
jgi:hypothetical protein